MQKYDVQEIPELQEENFVAPHFARTVYEVLSADPYLATALEQVSQKILVNSSS
jgi:hypothetical protein